MSEYVYISVAEKPDAQFLFEAVYGSCAVVQTCQIVEVAEALSHRIDCTATELLSGLEAFVQHFGTAPGEDQLTELVARRKMPVEPTLSTIIPNTTALSAYDRTDLSILREFGY